MAGCALTFLKTQEAQRTTHGRGIQVQGNRSQTVTGVLKETTDAFPLMVTRTTEALILGGISPTETLKEDPGLQVQWTYEIVGEWNDQAYTCPDS